VHFLRHESLGQADPLVIACLENNIPGMQSAIDKIPKNSKPKNMICQALYYAVKNNNKKAFDLLCTNKKMKKNSQQRSS